MLKILTVKTLMKVFGAPKKDASYIYKRALTINNLKEAEELLELLSNPRFVGGYGVEAIYHPSSVTRPALLYINKGDTYDNTIMFDRFVGRFYVGSWGDWIELRERKYGRFE